MMTRLGTTDLRHPQESMKRNKIETYHWIVMVVMLVRAKYLNYWVYKKKNFSFYRVLLVFFFLLVLFHSLLWYLLSFISTTPIIGASFETITFQSHKRAISIFYLVYFPCKAFLTVSFLFFFFLTLLNFSHSNVIKFCGV